MTSYNYFIENKLPFVFRYKYSNPNIIRTVFIKEHKGDKIIASEAFTCKIKSFKTDGIHFDTEDLLPKKYTDEICDEIDNELINFKLNDTIVGSNLKPTCCFKSFSLDEAENLKESGRFQLGDNCIEHDNCNEDKHRFLKYAIENNKTVAFEYQWTIHIMSPYRFCNFGNSVLMYNDKTDMFHTYDIDEIRFVRIPDEITEVDDLDISAIDEINEW